MRARLWIALLLVVLPATAAAQPRLPDEVLRVLQEECDARPGPMPDDRAFGDLLNAVAWRTRHLGMGLSRKAGGHHVDSPVGPIAEDVICDRATGHHWDVIAAAGVGRPLSCGGGPSIGVMPDPNRPCVPPVEPAGAAPSPGPSPTPAPTPAPTPTPVPSVDLTPVLDALARIEARLSALESRPAPSLDLFAAYVDDMVGNGPADNPALAENHVTDLKKRLDVIRVDLEQLNAWLRSRSALRW